MYTIKHDKPCLLIKQKQIQHNCHKIQKLEIILPRYQSYFVFFRRYKIKFYFCFGVTYWNKCEIVYKIFFGFHIDSKTIICTFSWTLIVKCTNSYLCFVLLWIHSNIYLFNEKYPSISGSWSRLLLLHCWKCNVG